MDLRGYEDELINYKKERKNPTSIKGKNVFIAGRFTDYNRVWIDNTFISRKKELEKQICKNKGNIKNSFGKNIDIVCWLVPFKETAIIQRARNTGVPIIRYGNFIKLMGVSLVV